MKKWILLLMSVSLFSVALGQGVEPTKGQGVTKAPVSKAHLLSTDELDKLFSEPQQLLLIDVRRPDEVSSVGGFPVYLSIQLSELEQEIKWIPRDRTIVTVSNHAGRAAKAADLLTAKGFKVAGAAGAETYEKDGGKWVTRIPIPAKPPATTAGK
jgi:rhodanese-related sulfurtransferase